MESEQKANKNKTKANKKRTRWEQLHNVWHASVTIDGQLKSKIGKGLLALVGIEDKDTQEDIEWLQKITNLRIFDDENGVMNRSVIEAEAADHGCQPIYLTRLYEKRELLPPT